MTITAVGFIDTFNLTVLLYRERRAFNNAQSIDLMSRLELKEWQAAKRAMDRALKILSNLDLWRVDELKPDVVMAEFTQTLPGAHTDWESDREFAETTMRFVLPIVTNPLMQHHAGPITATLPVGQLAFFDLGPLHSVVNLGDAPAYHLVIDVLKPAKE